MVKKIITCVPKLLPADLLVDAANVARMVNPANAPSADTEPQFLAARTTKYWGAKGVDLTVSFMEVVPQGLKDRTLKFMNTWGEFSNVKFKQVATGGNVRISYGPGGYFSYLGPDILSVAYNKQTMNLQALSTRTDEAEFCRVVWHETGHTLGFEHEHLRRELVARLDRAKVIAWGKRTQNWSEATSVAQMLTPIEEGALLEPSRIDPDSIMCYQFDGSQTLDGLPIRGGAVIDATDRAYAAKLYPKPDAPPPTDPPASKSMRLVVDVRKDGSGASVVSLTM